MIRFYFLGMVMMLAALPGQGAVGSAAGAMLEPAFIDAESEAAVNKLRKLGIDIAAVRRPEVSDTGAAFRVEAVLSGADRVELRKQGFSWRVPERRVESRQRSGGESAYHSFDEPGKGIKDRLEAVAQQNPHLVTLETIGFSIENRPVMAVGIGAVQEHDESVPEMLIIATHHAREWVAARTAMRLISHLTENYGIDPRVTALLSAVRVWIIPVANPDGYEYTFTHERLWRKNLRDNDGDGTITPADGVDLNRNFDSFWGYDEEGSDDDPVASTYRGTAPHSEPETRAVARFILGRSFGMMISYHTYGNYILYPWGWQAKTPSLDDPVFAALAGTDDNPAVRDSIVGTGYDPGLSADLTVANGSFDDWGYGVAKVPTFVVELTAGVDAGGNYYGFEFPDDEELLETVFEDNLEFALSCMESAADPSRPRSPVGIEVGELFHTPVTVSHGENQMISVTARKGEAPELHYRIGDSPLQQASFTERTGRFFNDGPGLFFTRYEATIPGQKRGDRVEYTVVSADGIARGPWTYEVVGAGGNRVLIVPGENRGATGRDDAGYLGYYTDALGSAGYGYDLYDPDVSGAVPSFAGVLSHYDAVVWYTGDDSRSDPGAFDDTVLQFREYLNFGGRLMASGQDLACMLETNGALSGDFMQYWLGAYRNIEGAGMDAAKGVPLGVEGGAEDPVLQGAAFEIHGGDGADNQLSPDTFFLTGDLLPHFGGALAAGYLWGEGSFAAHSGSRSVYSRIADNSYKRLGGFFTLPEEEAPTLSFRISYFTETDFDFVFVEIREAGTGQWTTLPDRNGLTKDAVDPAVPVSKFIPHLADYMHAGGNPAGAAGQWHGFTGKSNGWRHVEMDLSAYAGKRVELYISYVSDHALQELGVFVDDIAISGMGVEDFEEGTGSWEPSIPEFFHGTSNNWTLTSGDDFREGPVVRTENTLLFGFGFEAIDTAETRAELMGRTMAYFGVPSHRGWVPGIDARMEEGRVVVDVELMPGSEPSGASDWWIHAETPFGPVSWVYPGGWITGEHRSLLHDPAYVPGYNILDHILPAGSYTFHFGVDDNGDGIRDETWKSSAEIVVE